MVQRVDESVGRVVEALRRHGMLRDAIVVFSTDNGGPAEGFNLNAASNWPLRGVSLASLGRRDTSRASPVAESWLRPLS